MDWPGFAMLERFCINSGPGALQNLACAVAPFEGSIVVGLGLVLLAFSVWLIRSRRTPAGGLPLIVFPLKPDFYNVGGAAVPVVRPTVDSPDPSILLDRTPAAPRVPLIEAARQRPESDDDPTQKTLELLPGRLKVVSGLKTGFEIRFVRFPGGDPEFTIGRTEGPPYRHIQLDSPTISRIHARMVFSRLRWTVHNESETNPTKVNGRPLKGKGGIELTSGDQIDLGEVRLQMEIPDLNGAERSRTTKSWHSSSGRRSTNQDAVTVRALPGRDRELAVVCDGVGSTKGGRIAAELALNALIAAVESGKSLEEAACEANRRVIQAAREEPHYAGMSTTLVALLRDGDEYRVVNVGDSRAYRLGETGIWRITSDHSFVAEAVSSGAMTVDEARQSPYRNALTRSLGSGDPVQVDTFGPFPIRGRDRVILCSDGIHGILSDGEIEEISDETADVADVARALVEGALLLGGEDNASAAVLEFSGDS